MSKSSFVSLAIAAFLSLLASASGAQPLSGTWLTEDGSSRVRFEACGSNICGQIVWLKEPNDPATGKAWLDKFNPQANLKHRPLLGLTLLSELGQINNGKYEGKIYNPLDGRTYNGKLTPEGESKLKLKGCALAGLLCQSEIWTRVTE